MRYHSMWVQHTANPLHIYCRLIDLGVSAQFSRKISIIYERYFYPVLTKDLRQAWYIRRKRY